MIACRSFANEIRFLDFVEILRDSPQGFRPFAFDIGNSPQTNLKAFRHMEKLIHPGFTLIADDVRPPHGRKMEEVFPYIRERYSFEMKKYDQIALLKNFKRLEQW